MSDFDLNTLRSFERVVRAEVPDFRLDFKDRSVLMKLIGFLFPANPVFLSRSVTTAYPAVYFPSRKFYEANPRLSFTLLAHEMVRLIDSKNRPFWSRVAYLLPQALSIFPIVAFGVMAHSHAWVLCPLAATYLIACFCAKKSLAPYLILTAVGLISTGTLAVMLTHWLSFILFLGLLLAGPWPSAWRARQKMRGYTMHLAITQWLHGVVPTFYRESVAMHFTGPEYYFMSWSGPKVSNQVNDVCLRAQSGDLQNEFPYSVAHHFIASRGFLKG